MENKNNPLIKDEDVDCEVVMESDVANISFNRFLIDRICIREWIDEIDEIYNGFMKCFNISGNNELQWVKKEDEILEFFNKRLEELIDEQIGVNCYVSQEDVEKHKVSVEYRVLRSVVDDFITDNDLFGNLPLNFKRYKSFLKDYKKRNNLFLDERLIYTTSIVYNLTQYQAADALHQQDESGVALTKSVLDIIGQEDERVKALNSSWIATILKTPL